MKTRKSFVSNSSSCSFVIHKSYFKDEKIIAELKELFEKHKNNDDIYDDSGVYFHEQKNYIYFNAYHGYDEHIKPFLTKNGIKGDMICANMG